MTESQNSLNNDPLITLRAVQELAGRLIRRDIGMGFSMMFLSLTTGNLIVGVGGAAVLAESILAFDIHDKATDCVNSYMDSTVRHLLNPVSE